MRILIADDDRVSRILLRRILDKVPGATIVEAADGNAAWEVLNQQPLADVCILDNIMPGLTGLAILEKMRSEPKLMHLPVIMCTSSREFDCVERAAKLRVHHYILKPFQAQLVLQNVFEVQREAESRRALDDLQEVCERLGVDEAVYTELLGVLVSEIEPSLNRISSALGDGAFQVALLEANGLRGACANLGARLMVEGLSLMEEALRDAVPALRGDDSDGGRVCFDRVPKLVSILDHLRYECGRLQVVARPVVAPPGAPPTAGVSPAG